MTLWAISPGLGRQFRRWFIKARIVLELVNLVYVQHQDLFNMLLAYQM